MLKTLRLGLRAKLVMLVIAGIVTAFSIIGGFRVYAGKHNIMDEMMRSGQERTGLIAEAVANMLIGYDYSNMESLAERITQQPDVRQVTIRNRDGKIMVTRARPSMSDGTGLNFESPVLFGVKPVGKVELRLSLERANHELQATYRSIIMEQIFFGLFLGLLIYFAASRVIVKPVRRIGQHMKSVLRSDEVVPPEQLDIPNRDEIGELAQIFNNLNQQIYGMQQRLREKVDLAGTALMNTNEQLQLRSNELEQRSQDLEKALALVEKLAITDSLTELHNRRYFDENLASAFPRAQRYDESLCLVLLDVDNFKQINDSLGHSAGDLVLQTLGKLIKSRVREYDTSARVGGDEFAFLLYHTSMDNAMKIAQSCLKLIANHLFEFGGAPIGVSLSIGIASNRDVSNSVQALFGAADEALYEAKRRGRNQVVAYPFSH